MTASRIGEMNPLAVWAALEADPDALLVDVRTRAEWSFVGVPDLSAIGRQPVLAEWRRYPGMGVNSGFAEEVLSQVETVPARMFFICRSGARSREAAESMAEHLAARGQAVECVNVAEGFEGDLDRDGHRSRVNGWRMRGLAWRQS